MDEGIITLRILVWQTNKIFRAICLETDLAFEANSEKELKEKMSDGIVGYLSCFSMEELKQKKFYKKAPLRYRFLWFLIPAIKLFNTDGETVNYSPQTGSLNFA